MENSNKTKAITALGALGYLVNVHIEDGKLKTRLLIRIAEVAEYFQEELTEKCNICGAVYTGVCTNCDHVKIDADADFATEQDIFYREHEKEVL